MINTEPKITSASLDDTKDQSPDKGSLIQQNQEDMDDIDKINEQRAADELVDAPQGREAGPTMIGGVDALDNLGDAIDLLSGNVSSVISNSMIESRLYAEMTNIEKNTTEKSVQVGEKIYENNSEQDVRNLSNPGESPDDECFESYSPDVKEDESPNQSWLTLSFNPLRMFKK